jgi:hypothetical protein
MKRTLDRIGLMLTLGGSAAEPPATLRQREAEWCCGARTEAPLERRGEAGLHALGMVTPLLRDIAKVMVAGRTKGDRASLATLLGHWAHSGKCLIACCAWKALTIVAKVS